MPFHTVRFSCFLLNNNLSAALYVQSCWQIIQALANILSADTIDMAACSLGWLHRNGAYSCGYVFERHLISADNH